MDNQRFDAITRLAATSPDRRGALKLAGVAALLGTAGFLSRSDDTEAALLTVVIANSLNDVIEVNVKNNNVAVQICAVVQDINVALLSTFVDAAGSTANLTCNIVQNNGGGGGNGNN
jgi:hypothetical protein